jgi:hypothetical protein
MKATHEGEAEYAFLEDLYLISMEKKNLHTPFKRCTALQMRIRVGIVPSWAYVLPTCFGKLVLE